MRRGQIALYVILGILVLILVALLFVLRKPAQPEMEILPADFQPVQTQVVSCLHDATVDALKRMALHGGYLDPLDQDEVGEALTLNPIAPTESDLVQLHPGDPESAIPYYLYYHGPNQCTSCPLVTLIPSREHMQEQVRKYVLQHLHECLNFGVFTNIEVLPDPEQDVEVTMFDESVEVVYLRRVEMRQGDNRQLATTFISDVEIPFLRYHHLAREMTRKQAETQYLENWMLYLISAYSGIEADLPPLGGYEESFSPKIWALLAVQEKFRQILYSTTPALQVMRTQGVQPPPSVSDPYVQGFLTTTYLDLLNESLWTAEDVRVSILYPNLPIYMNVRPSEDQLIKPRTERTGGILLVPSRQQNYYDFFYDVSAPFIIEIRHQNATAGTDISFLFALEANLRDNKNLVEWMLGRGTIPWTHDNVAWEVAGPGADPPPSTNATNGTPSGEPGYAHNESLETLLCDPSQRLSRLQVRTFDGQTNQPLSEVQFSFTCGLYASCRAGYSSLDTYGMYAELDQEVPQCLGGTLKAEKEGYNTLNLRVSTRNGQSQRLPDITLEPFVEREIRFEKRQVSRNPVTGALGLGAAQPLEGHESVFATLTRVPMTLGEGFVNAMAMMSNTSNLTMVKLVPGLYEVRAHYIDDHGHIIPAGCMEVEGNLIPEDPVEIQPAPWGGVQLTNATQLWHLGRNELYHHNTIVVTVFVAPPPFCLNDLEGLDGGESFSRRWIDEAMPHFE